VLSGTYASEWQQHLDHPRARLIRRAPASVFARDQVAWHDEEENITYVNGAEYEPLSQEQRHAVLRRAIQHGDVYFTDI
jgi:hypothetical protein